MDDDGRKRAFPYHSEVKSFALKRGPLHGAHPGREAQDPRVFQQHHVNEEDDRRSGTDFTKWTDQQIKDFLDQRGGDYDDCPTRAQLVERAVELEVNTGPAKPPAQEEEEYDPLDAFMDEVDAEVAAQKPTHKAKPVAAPCDEEPDSVDYMQMRKAAGAAALASATASAGGGGGGADSDEEVYATARAVDAAQQQQGAGYDSDDNPVLDNKRGTIDPLAPVDHSLIEYDAFAKDFYDERPEVFAMDDNEVNAYRRHLELRVAGFDVPRPVKTFEQCSFDAGLAGAIAKAGYDKPTAIQAQALPAALSGRDVLGVAKTGSGKTAAFVLPMLVHIADQREVDKGEGPVGLVVAPTRELAEQIHKETRKFAKPYNFRVSAAFGGLSKYEQVKGLKAGCEAAICTPGRILDLIKMKACTMRRVTYLVFDEADRMFDMGFEPQVRSILGQVRPDRQTLLFSATMPHKIERLVADALTSPVRITVGISGVANEDVKQHIHVLQKEADKTEWLATNLPVFIDEGEVLVFASQRAKVEQLVEQLTKAGVKAGAMHGEMDQYTRMSVLDSFRTGKLHVLVATDVAARGLDIKTLRCVVNYDASKDIDTHIHRVGRTGRAGDKEGQAHTLLLPGDSRFAVELEQSLALGGQGVPAALHELALKDPAFRKGNSRAKGGRGGRGGGRKPQVGGAGLGFGPGGGGGGGGGGGMLGGRGGLGGGRGGGGVSTKPSSTFVQLPGFAKSSDEYEQEGSAAAAVRPAPPAATPGPEPSTTGRSDVVRSFHAGRFKSSFVSSGSTGGDVGATPMVIAPKVPTPAAGEVTTSASRQPGGYVPPPPVPVTERPMYLQQQTFASGRRANTGASAAGSSFHNMPPPASLGGGGGGSTGSYNKAPPPAVLSAGPTAAPAAPGMSSAAAAQAIAMAQAIAARLAAQGVPGGAAGPAAALPPPPAGPPPAAAMQFQQAQAAAAAIAARLAAQAPPGGGGPPQEDAPPPPRNRWDKT